jgi:hypothetical protein
MSRRPLIISYETNIDSTDEVADLRKTESNVIVNGAAAICALDVSLPYAEDIYTDPAYEEIHPPFSVSNLASAS